MIPSNNAMGLIIETCVLCMFLFIFLKSKRLFSLFEKTYKLSSLYYFYNYVFGIILSAILSVHILAFCAEGQTYVYIDEITRALFKTVFVIYLYALWKRPYSLKIFPVTMLVCSMLGVAVVSPYINYTYNTNLLAVHVLPAVLSAILFLYISYRFIRDHVNGVTKRILGGLLCIALSTVCFIGSDINIIKVIDLDMVGDICIIFATLFMFIPVFREDCNGH
jgi:hypothetical protein